jgi:hypothetical protein
MAHISDTKPDKRNARRHTPRNLAQIETSIQRDGFGRSILLANDGTIIAGNATTDAAGSAGLEDMLIVDSDGSKIIAVRRTDVEPGSERFINLALSDNRAAELADWDSEMLRQLADDGADLSQFWFDDELDALLAELTNEPNQEQSAGVDEIPEQWALMIECENEDEQAALLERLTAEGLRCRALIS